MKFGAFFRVEMADSTMSKIHKLQEYFGAFYSLLRCYALGIVRKNAEGFDSGKFLVDVKKREFTNSDFILKLFFGN